MTIILVGLNHRTAPVELREQLALTGSALPIALEALSRGSGTSATPSPDGSGRDRSRNAGVHEGVILSTCNRFEVYAVVDDHSAGWQHVEAFLAGLQGIAPAALTPHLYRLAGTDAVAHLMRVACGLDSMILGEPQILGQVTQAFDDARAASFTGPILSHLFSRAIHAGKRARTETHISRYTTSVSSAGAQMVLDNIHTKAPSILVLGAGEMAVLAARSLQKHGAEDLVFINRTYDRAVELAAELGGTALSWHQLSVALTRADAVITATGAPHTVIYAEDVQAVLERRGDRPLVFVDIAVPRDVEVAVGDLPGVRRFDIDDLQSIVDTNTAQRQAAVPRVEMIIDQETSTFLEWYHSRSVTPVIKDLRRWAAEVAELEVQQALNKLGDVDTRTTEIVNRLAQRLVNKLLHEPTVRLRGQAAEGNGFGYAHAVSELFGLHSTACDRRRDICEKASPDASGESCNLQCIMPVQKP